MAEIRERIKGASRVIAEVRGPKEDVARAIRQISGVKNVDIAKRLLDHGFHPPTMSFPLIVHGALMIEPTESDGIDELDQFIAAMKEIAREARETPDLVKGAPYTTPVRRLDEVRAARQPVLRWQRPRG